MWYIAFTSVILALVLLIMVTALWKPQHAQRLLGHQPRKKHVVFVGLPLVLLALLGMIFGLWIYMRAQTAAQTKQQANDPNRVMIQQKIAATDTIPAYELLSQTAKGNDSRITVVVSTKDATKLTLLNNKLIGQYKVAVTIKTLYIDYFDDRQAAKDYFSKISDKKIAQKDRTNLAKHYVAIATFSRKLGPKFVMLPDVAALLKK